MKTTRPKKALRPKKATGQKYEQPKAGDWNCLPGELRNQIQGEVVRMKHPGWASLASVCKEWQSFLEAANFRKMDLRSDDLAQFAIIATPQRQEFIDEIRFTVELPLYMPICCNDKSDPALEGFNNIVRDGIQNLVEILSSWRSPHRVSLELNAYSTTDREHHFKNICLRSEDAEQDHDAMVVARKTQSRYHDPHHGWHRGEQVRSPPESAMGEVFAPIQLNFPRPLPPVTAVDSLTISRHFRRSIINADMSHLLKRFRCLQSLCLEPWAPDGPMRDLYDQDLALMKKRGLPNCVKNVVLFEDNHRHYETVQRPPAAEFFSRTIDPEFRLGGYFTSWRSMTFRNIAVSFVFDASDMIEIRKRPFWPRLKTLSLTSKLLVSDYSKKQEAIDALLLMASRRVRKMPRLHTFVLWNCEIEDKVTHAYAFIYRIDGDTISITCRGTWQMPLAEAVVEGWQAAAAKRRLSQHTTFQFHYEKIDATLNSMADAIHHLKLPVQLQAPGSLESMQHEAFKL